MTFRITVTLTKQRHPNGSNLSDVLFSLLRVGAKRYRHDEKRCQRALKCVSIRENHIGDVYAYKVLCE